MAISANRVTRLGHYGGMDRPNAGFGGKTEQTVTPAASSTQMIKDVGRMMNP